jgi:hypothetical protein
MSFDDWEIPDSLGEGTGGMGWVNLLNGFCPSQVKEEEDGR